jgi:hypothetical protein
VVLSEKPPITTTIQSLPPALLDTLVTELSTLASVYHKAPETFLGQGRFGAEEMQKAAIEEQLQLAKENPTVAAIAAATASGGSAAPQSNMENLLDIDFDGSAPASLSNAPKAGASGLEGLAGTPQRVASPVAGSAQPSNTMDDLMGVFGGSSAPPQNAASGGGGLEDLMGGFGGLDMNGGTQPPPPQTQLAGAGSKKQTNDDILGLF